MKRRSRFSMKLSQPKFIKAVSHVRRFADGRGGVPILQQARLVVRGDELRLMCYNMQIEAVSAFSIKDGTDIDVCVDANLLLAALKTFAAKDPISLELNEGTFQLHLKSGRASVFLDTMSASRFPVIDAPEQAFAFKLPAEHLSALFDGVLHSSDPSELRPNVQGLGLTKVNGHIEACATDGKRVSISKADFPLTIDGFAPLHFHHSDAFNIAAAVKPLRGEVLISGNHKKVRIAHEDVMLTIATHHSEHIDYKSFLPNRDEYGTASFDAQSLRLSVDRALLFNDDPASAVVLEFDGSGVDISAFKSKGGNSHSRIDLPESSALGRYALNGRHFSDSLKKISADTIKISVCEGQIATFIEGEGNDLQTEINMTVRR